MGKNSGASLADWTAASGFDAASTGGDNSIDFSVVYPSVSYEGDNLVLPQLFSNGTVGSFIALNSTTGAC